MTPFHVKKKILVLPLASHHSYRLARTNQKSVLDAPSLGRSIDVNPPTQISSIEQIDPFRKISTFQIGHWKQLQQKEKKNGWDGNIFHGFS
tara:strand:+ start:1235 stop:1507 length:273 start_codon:yes stop_codon:yes gene_type:complete